MLWSRSLVLMRESIFIKLVGPTSKDIICYGTGAKLEGVSGKASVEGNHALLSDDVTGGPVISILV